MEIIQKALLLLTSFLTGFGIVIPLLCFVKTKDLQKTAFKNLFTLTAIKAVRYVGILYIAIFLLKTFAFYGPESNPWASGYKTMISGQYWLLYWFSPVIYFVLSQLFWLKKVYTNKWLMVLFGLLMLILPAPWFLQVVINIGKGLNSTKFTAGEAAELTWYILSVVIFIFTTFTIILATGKLKTIVKQ